MIIFSYSCPTYYKKKKNHYILQYYCEVIMSVMVSQITSVFIVCSIVCSCADQRKYQSSASLAFVWGIHRWPVNSPHKWPVTRKTLPFDDAIVENFDITMITVVWHSQLYSKFKFKIYVEHRYKDTYIEKCRRPSIGFIWLYILALLIKQATHVYIICRLKCFPSLDDIQEKI